MSKSLLMSLLLSVCFVIQVMAQERTVTGKVTDSETGQGIPGVSVFVKGTTTGTVTDTEGNFSIQAASDATLVFQSVGMITQEFKVGNQTSFSVAMSQDTKQLGEVVVVGYGTQDRRELTSSVAKVTSATIRELPVAGIDQALQGRAAGVQITTNSGTPGGGITVRVRGSSSISASAQPLYVIDGVPMITGDFSQLGFGGQNINALTDLNPADIESIEVLKDAASSAIYGSRASNGVVLITTKRGAAIKTQFNLNVFAGFQRVWKTPDFLGRQDYLNIMTEALINDGFIAPTDLGSFDTFIDTYYSASQAATLRTYPAGNDTDWIDEVLRTATIQSYELNVSGGNERTKYFISGAYFDQDGLVIGSRFQRFSTRLNLDHNVSKKLSFNTTLQLSRAVNNRIVSDNTLFGPFANALAASPLFPVRDPNGAYTRPNFFYSNPVAEGLENDDTNNSFRTIGNVSATWKVLNNLSLTGKIGVDLLNFIERRYTPTNYVGSSSTATGGAGTKTNSLAARLFVEVFGNYNFTLQENHNFGIVVGVNREENIRERSFVSGISFPGEKFRYLSSAATINNGTDVRDGNSLLSFIGRLNYGFKNKYLFSVNFRADGSSRFGPNNRWGYFPAASVGWRISEESFLDNAKFISELKVRASYGATGNQEFGDFSWRYLYGGGNYLDQAGIFQTQIPNQDLKWESTRQLDFGLDLSLFEGRVNLTADYYIKTTEDLLFNRPIAQENGFGTFATNIGSVENRGFEFTLGGTIFPGVDNGFKWTADLNMSFNRNKVLSLYQGEDVFYGFGGNSLVLREGEPIGTFFGFISDGVYSRTEDVPAARAALGIQAGDMNYRDVNGDGIITDDDLTIIGNAQPDFIGGFTNIFSYKGFDLNVFLQFSYGNETWNAAGNFQQGMLANFFEDNQTSAVLRRWQREGDVTNVPRATTDVSVNRNNESNTTRFVENGSYLRVKNVILGYNFKPELIKRVGLRSLRIYAQAQNLFTFTDYSGFDPEVNFAGTSNTTIGVDFYTFPQPRTFTFGLNIGF